MSHPSRGELAELRNSYWAASRSSSEISCLEGPFLLLDALVMVYEKCMGRARGSSDGEDGAEGVARLPG